MTRPPLDPTPLHALRRHIRLWRRFLMQSIVRETHYRTNFIATIVVGLMQLGFSLIPVFLLYSFTDDINGWSRGDVIALGGVFQISMAMLWLAIEPNMERMSSYVREGDLDLILIRPVSGLFYIMLRWIKPAEIFMVISGSAVTVAGLASAGASPGIGAILRATILTICGIVLIGCVWTAIVMLAFWFTTIGSISMLVADVLQAGKYPVAFYPAAIRIILSFVFPVGFIATFPVDALTGRGGWTITLVGVMLATTALVLLRAWWRYATRFYSSASS
ncbi:MAG TPA: ABC-2 family transporter protein [Thermomicrobiales bacterium]|nr:ABC-2 family transporter protein [Thermomicrobiales bacterium]